MERKSLARELRRVWVRELAHLLTATVSRQQAPAPRTAMPAVSRVAEVIIAVEESKVFSSFGILKFANLQRNMCNGTH